MGDDILVEPAKPDEKIEKTEGLSEGFGGKNALRLQRHGSLHDYAEETSEDQDGSQSLVFSCPVDHEGTFVYVKGWIKPESKKRPLLIIHGLGEELSLYRDAARSLNGYDYSVFVFDLRGHGRSGSVMGHIPDFNVLVNDLLQVVGWIRHKCDRMAPFIVGQGIGALITLYFQRAYPKLAPGAVLLAPCFTQKVSFSLRFAIKTMAEVSPTMRLPKGLTPKFLLPVIKPGAKTNFSGITANFANEMILALAGVAERFRNYTCPSLILCPNNDQLVDYSWIFEIVGRHPQKNLLEIREIATEHSMLVQSNEPFQQVIGMIAGWFDKVEKDLRDIKNTPRQAAVPVTSPSEDEK